MIIRILVLLIALSQFCSIASADGKDWSVGMIESTMKRYPTAKDLGSWGYAKSLYLYGQYLVYKRTREPRYLKYIKDWVDYHVDAEGVHATTSTTIAITKAEKEDPSPARRERRRANGRD